MMRTVMQLDKEDLQSIIAERFNVPLSKVRMTCKQTGYGYNADETTEYVPFCEVGLEKSDDKTQ